VRPASATIGRRGGTASAPPDLDYRPGMTIESLIEVAVERAVSRVLRPHLHRLQMCEPMVFTVAQTAEVLQLSEDTIGRLVRRGVLPRVPHLDGKVLIPRQAVVRLVADQSPDQLAAEPSTDGSPASSRSMRSAAC
jgi:excisionase family DNA binding protein